MRILLIEDDAALADGLIRALQGAGHLCDHLSRGLHAPAALASAPYDVMVLDLSLPDVDGWTCSHACATTASPCRC